MYSSARARIVGRQYRRQKPAAATAAAAERRATTSVLLRAAVLLMGLMCAACGPSTGEAPPVAEEAAPTVAFSPTAEAALYADPVTAAAMLITLENQGAHQRDRGQLVQLWASDAVIVDGRNTATEADDYRWQGHAAVLDRYDVAVFPAPPPLLAAPPTPILNRTQGDRAWLTNGDDRWTMQKLDGRWYLAELHYQQVE